MNDFVITPLQLSLIIQAYSTPTYKGIEDLKTNDTWQSQFHDLLNSGMICEITTPLPSGCDWPYQLTEKGEVWFNAIMTTPLPVQKWEIPNE